MVRADFNKVTDILESRVDTFSFTSLNIAMEPLTPN